MGNIKEKAWQHADVIAGSLMVATVGAAVLESNVNSAIGANMDMEAIGLGLVYFFTANTKMKWRSAIALSAASLGFGVLQLAQHNVPLGVEFLANAAAIPTTYAIGKATRRVDQVL